MQEQKRKRDAGTLVRGQVSVEAFIEWWLENIVHEECIPATYESYSSLARNHLFPDPGDTMLDKLTEDQVPALKAQKRCEGKSPRTVEYFLIILRIALNLAKRRGLVAKNVAAQVNLPRVPQREAQTLDRDAGIRFIQAARGHRL